MTSILYNNPFDKTDEFYQRSANLLVSNPFSKEFAAAFRDFNMSIIECSEFPDQTTSQKNRVIYWDRKAKNMTDFIKKLTKLAEEVHWQFVEYKI